MDPDVVACIAAYCLAPPASYFRREPLHWDRTDRAVFDRTIARLYLAGGFFRQFLAQQGSYVREQLEFSGLALERPFFDSPDSELAQKYVEQLLHNGTVRSVLCKVKQEDAFRALFVGNPQDNLRNRCALRMLSFDRSLSSSSRAYALKLVQTFNICQTMQRLQQLCSNSDSFPVLELLACATMPAEYPRTYPARTRTQGPRSVAIFFPDLWFDAPALLEASLGTDPLSVREICDFVSGGLCCRWLGNFYRSWGQNLNMSYGQALFYAGSRKNPADQLPTETVFSPLVLTVLFMYMVRTGFGLETVAFLAKEPWSESVDLCVRIDRTREHKTPLIVNFFQDGLVYSDPRQECLRQNSSQFIGDLVQTYLLRRADHDGDVFYRAVFNAETRLYVQILAMSRPDTFDCESESELGSDNPADMYSSEPESSLDLASSLPSSLASLETRSVSPETSPSSPETSPVTPLPHDVYTFDLKTGRLQTSDTASAHNCARIATFLASSHTKTHHPAVHETLTRLVPACAVDLL